MNRVPTALPSLLALVGLLSFAVPAWGDAAGDKVLKITDTAMTRAKDQVYEYEITTQEPGKAKTKLMMRVSIKGKEWRLIDFLAPGDIKGMRYLILSFSQMWVYLPQYQKVRRVASHARAQSFMGTALSQDAADTLKVLIECRQNVVIAGGTGSGKTSLLNALSALIPEGERVIVIEDARELQLQREHVVQLEARPPDARGKGVVTIRDLFKASLRMRPDRIVLGEIRGGEALDLVQAMTSGHGGCMTTVHATYPIDTLNRLETLALMGGVELPLHALRAQLASAVDIIVQTSRTRDGRRRVTHISEVLGADAHHGYQLSDLFASCPVRPLADGTVPFGLVPTGALPGCVDIIRSHGLELPTSIAHAAQCKLSRQQVSRP